MEKTELFSGRAKDYLIGRPSYAKEFLDYLKEKYHNSRHTFVADVGSGTGKFALQLLECGFSVYGIEPNEDMRQTAEQMLGAYEGFHSINGSASNTNVAGAQFDFITSAQAFHWFDVMEFQKECQRILKKNGKVFLLWNLRDAAAEVNIRNYNILQQYCPNFTGFSGGIEKDDERIKSFFHNTYEVLRYENPIKYTKEKFLSRNLSGSYSFKKGELNFEAYLMELENLFDHYSINGILEVPNHTIVYAGTVDEIVCVA